MPLLSVASVLGQEHEAVVCLMPRSVGMSRVCNKRSLVSVGVPCYLNKREDGDKDTICLEG
jgi:hypothetical protein